MVNVNNSKIKKKLNTNLLDMIDWMLAIDFDPFEVRFARRNLFHKYVQVLDKSAFTVKLGD